jgi:hypothetical protein
VRGLAAAIGWNYVEVHANHFVADGMDKIHSKADEIFRRLMELDHTVVLFDEIDELVREREEGKEAFGRFLTTSMLPKLAELWEQRRTLYFVATNHIKYFDRAITRSQRFDALILVAPSSFEAKVEELGRLLHCGEACKLEFGEDEFWPVLQRAGRPRNDTSERAEPLNGGDVLAKFVLLRFDQLAELAVHISNAQSGDRCMISTPTLCTALSSISDRNLSIRAPYLEFMEDVGYSRRDYDKWQVWELDGIDEGLDVSEPIFRSQKKAWLVVKDGYPPPQELLGRKVVIGSPAVLKLD